MKKVGLWIRVSTEDQAEGESPEHHEVRGRAYASAKGWIVTEVYRLTVSGKSVIDCPETKRMINDMASGRIEGLIFSKLARLARNTKELIEISEHFEKHKADLISIEESIDTSTPAGRLLFTLIGALAQWEREEIAARVAASVPVRAKLGKPLGGQAPFGYRWVNKKLIVDPKEVPIVKEIYQHFVKLKRIKTTARALNKKGYRTRNGSLWSDTSIRRLITGLTAKGKHILNHTKSRGEGKGWDAKPEEDWVVIDTEPIVDEELWEEANSILKSTRRKRTKKPKAYLLSGLTYCGLCGGKMYGDSHSRCIPKYRCKACNHKIYLEDLDRVFVKSLKDYQFRPEHLVGELPDAKKIKETEKVLEITKNTLKNINCDIDNLLQLRKEKLIDDGTFKERIYTLEERRDQLKKEIPQIEIKLSLMKVKLNSDSFVLDKAKSFAALFPTLNFDEKRSLTEEILDSIVVDKDKIRFSLFYLPEFQTRRNGDEPMPLWISWRPKP